MHDALLGNQAPKKLTMQDVTFMVEKLSPNDAAIIYNTFKFVNDHFCNVRFALYGTFFSMKSVICLSFLLWYTTKNATQSHSMFF